MTESSSTDETVDRRVSRWYVLLGIALVSLNLRPSITSVSPLLETIRADTEISYTAVSLLTSVPVVCMGVFALATPAVTRRVGRERGVFWGLVLIAVATFARVAGRDPLVLFGSTVLVGVGIAISQTLLPPVVEAYYPDRVAFATGFYNVALAVGAALGSAFTVPLWSSIGSWPAALAVWGVLAVVALAVWVRVPGAGESNPDVPRGSARDRSLPLRSGLAWLLVFFLGGASNLFYSAVTWLPPRYVALGWSPERAGALLTAFVVAQIVGMGLISAFGDRSRERRHWIAFMLALVFLGAVGVATAPRFYPLMQVGLLGAGSGGLFTISLTLPVDFAADEETTVHLSTMVFAGGYAVGAVGPSLVGLVLDVGGSYRLVFLGFAALALVMGVASTALDPDRAKIRV